MSRQQGIAARQRRRGDQFRAPFMKFVVGPLGHAVQILVDFYHTDIGQSRCLQSTTYIRRNHPTDRNLQRAYRIADNKYAENSHWNFEFVAAEFQAIDEAGVDLEDTGFYVTRSEGAPSTPRTSS